jgi:hypothetical protein
MLVRGHDNTKAGRSLNQSRLHGPSGREAADLVRCDDLLGGLAQRYLKLLPNQMT